MKKILISLIAAVASVGMVAYGAPSTVASYAAPNLVSEINTALANPTHNNLIVSTNLTVGVAVTAASARVNGILSLANGEYFVNDQDTYMKCSGHLVSLGDGTFNLGASTQQWNYLYLKNDAAMEALVVRDDAAFGTNVTCSALTASKPVFTDGSKVLTSSGTLGADQGGTGVASPTDHAVLVGSGASAVTPITVGANGELLIGQTSADPAFKPASGDWTINAGGTNVIGSDKVTTGKMNIPADSKTLLDSANYATMRTNMGVNIGSDVQAYDADLDTWATVTPSANGQSLVALANYATMRTNLGVNIGSDVQAYDADLDTWAGITPSANAQALLLLDYAAMRTNLTLVIGTDVQAYDADLTTWAGITPSANAQALLLLDYAAMRTNLTLVIGTDVQAYDADLDTWATVTPSSDGQALVATANYATMRTNLGVNIGSDVQAYDAQLDTWSTVTPSADAQAFVAAADYAAMRTNLLGTATLYSGTYTNGPNGYTNVVVVVNGAIVSVTTNP